MKATYPLFVFRNIIYQMFRGFPTKTRVCNGFTVDSFADFLASFFNITFYHDTLDQTMNIVIQLAAVHDLFDNTNLLLKLLVGIIVVGINDTGRIL